MTTSNRIAAIRERLRAVDSLPWKRSESYSCDYYYDGWSVDTRRGDFRCIEDKEDAELIAHAPSDLEYLLELLEQREKQLISVIFDWGQCRQKLRKNMERLESAEAALRLIQRYGEVACEPETTAYFQRFEGDGK